MWWTHSGVESLRLWAVVGDWMRLQGVHRSRTFSNYRIMGDIACISGVQTPSHYED